MRVVEDFNEMSSLLSQWEFRVHSHALSLNMSFPLTIAIDFSKINAPKWIGICDFEPHAKENLCVSQGQNKNKILLPS